MRFSQRSVAIALMAWILALTAADVAWAQSRELTGRVVGVDAKRLTIEKRGDRLRFVRAEKTRIGGAKSSWGDLAVGDWVTVEWKLADNPPRAYRVTVLPGL